MKLLKHWLLITAALATTFPAHSALYEMEFSTIVSSVSRNDTANEISSIEISGRKYSVGDHLTARLLFDSDMQPTSSQSQSYYDQEMMSVVLGSESYKYSGLSVTLTHNGNPIDSYLLPDIDLSVGYVLGYANHLWISGSSENSAFDFYTFSIVPQVGAMPISYLLQPVIGNYLNYRWAATDDMEIVTITGLWNASTVTLVPEPMAYLMLLGGLGLLIVHARRKRPAGRNGDHKRQMSYVELKTERLVNAD